MKSGELASRLYVSDSIIRHWSGEFAEFLSGDASPEKPGKTREFDRGDQLVMASIRALRDEGDGYEEIHAKLRDGWRLEQLPAKPERGMAAPSDNPPPITAEQHRLALRRLVDKDEEIARLRGELAQERSDRAELYERIIRETEARARLEGELNAYKSGRRWPWQRDQPGGRS